MPAIQLFEDTTSAALHPFHLIEGVAGVRFGAFTQAERWGLIIDAIPESSGATGGPVLVNARWVPGQGAAEMIGRLEDGDSLVDDGVVLAKRGNMVHGQGKAWAPDAKQEVLSHANELFAKLGEAILKDASLAASEWNLAPWGGSGATAVYGDAGAFLVSPLAQMRAASVDTESGPVLIAPGAHVEPGAHIKGPVIICEGATIRMGARILGPTVIGPHCKVGGEISNVNFQGWANKAHDGFLGNSVVGRWCNLGAGTESSNLKNTYGEVRQWDATQGALSGTGLQFCGLLMGDHSKCGIGTTFNTGTVVDPGCVIFDAGFPPKHLPPFSWYNARTEAMAIQSIDRMLSTAEKVMARRGETLSEDHRAKLTRLHAERQAAD